MRKTILTESGKSFEADEGDFFYLQQILEEAMDILKPYGCDSALQYLQLVEQLASERREEIFNHSTPVIAVLPPHPLNNLWNIPDIDFQDRRQKSRKD